MLKRNYLTIEEVMYIVNEIKKNYSELNQEIISISYAMQFLLVDDEEFEKLKKENDILKIYNYSLEKSLYCPIHNVQNFDAINRILKEENDISKNVKIFLNKVYKKINKTKPVDLKEISEVIKDIKNIDVNK